MLLGAVVHRWGKNHQKGSHIFISVAGSGKGEKFSCNTGILKAFKDCSGVLRD